MHRSDLLELLQHPNLHEIAGQAHARREERFGAETSFAAIEHLDLGSGRRWCAACGLENDGFAPSAVDLSEASTEIHLLMPDAVPWTDRVAAVASIPAGNPVVPRTVVAGTLSELLASSPDAADWTQLGQVGTAVVSDGVHPRIHPAVGQTEAWSQGWRAVAAATLTGQASVLYGPAHDADAVLSQIEAVARLQSERHVFWSVTPLIFHPESFGGIQDNLLTHGGTDLRVLAALRLGLPDVPHVRVEYNRSDLKLAHISLTSGADDLSGHLHLSSRSQTASANAKDLSLDEMSGWLQEVGFAPMIRNARYETAPVAQSASSSGGTDR